MDFEELDNILKQIGFSNGINDADFDEDKLEYSSISFDSKGILGYKRNKKIGYEFCQLQPKNGESIPAWKITSPTGCFVYIFTKCGNAFYPFDEKPCDKCHKVKIEIPGDETECLSALDTITYISRVSVRYITGYYPKKPKVPRLPKYSEKIEWISKRKIEKIIIPELGSTKIVTPGLIFEAVICSDQTVTAPMLARLNKEGENTFSYKKQYDNEILIDVEKQQYNFIKEENSWNVSSQQPANSQHKIPQQQD